MMQPNILNIKHKLFGLNTVLDEGQISSNFQENKFSLEEILESLARESEGKKAFIFSPEQQIKDITKLDETLLLVEENGKEKKPDFLFYELFENTYYLYTRKKDKEEIKHYTQKFRQQEPESYGLFAPAGVIVRRVPQSVLGNGVLGRAFIYNNYIEILDSLIGNEYTEVLTHEVLHILHPEKKEMEIRQMTRNYIGVQNTVYH